MKPFETVVSLVRSKRGYLNESDVSPWYQNYFDQAQELGLVGVDEDISDYADGTVTVEQL